MNNLITEQVEKYIKDKNVTVENATREVIQEITLFALSKTDFFEKAAFCGGTSLRILYGLDRASEDLDFSLLDRDTNFELSPYIEEIVNTFKSFNIVVDGKVKKEDGSIKSAFIKDNTIIRTISLSNIHIDPRVVIKVKLEVDTNPPQGAESEYKYVLFPFPHRIRSLTLPSLFSGKLHAIIARNWEKGRDYYDYVFYLSKGVKPNLVLLENALKQTGELKESESLDINKTKELLLSRFTNLDMNVARNDCINFINERNKLDIWSKDFFINITNDYFK